MAEKTWNPQIKLQIISLTINKNYILIISNIIDKNTLMIRQQTIHIIFS